MLPVSHLLGRVCQVRTHFQKVATDMPKGNRWDARQEEGNEVNDDEWS